MSVHKSKKYKNICKANTEGNVTRKYYVLR